MKANKELIPEWDATASYSSGDKVVFKGKIWTSRLGACCNHIPGSVLKFHYADGSFCGFFSPWEKEE